MCRARRSLVILAALLFAACAASEQVTLTPVTRTLTPSVVPSSAGPSATAPSPTVESTPTPPSPTPASTRAPTSRLKWTKAGELDVGRGTFNGLTRIEGGYLAWGSVYPKGVDADEADPVLATWVSSDLRTWRRKVHSKLIVPCPGWAIRPDLDAVSGTSDGTTFVFVAGHRVPDASIDGGCDRTEIISLASRDGITWTRSAPFRPPQSGDDQWLYPVGPWQIPGGWELHVPTGETARTVWQSSDLFEWQPAGTIPEFENGGWGVLAVAPDGTRVGFGTISASGGRVVGVSTDGVTWRAARTVPEAAWVPWALPPDAVSDRWVIPVIDGASKARLLLSGDLQRFERVAFPRAGLGPIVRTPAGWVAVGFTPQMDTGCDPCTAPDEALYTSRDGKKWTKRPNALTDKNRTPMLVADGDRVLGLVERGGVVGIWRLEPPY